MDRLIMRTLKCAGIAFTLSGIFVGSAMPSFASYLDQGRAYLDKGKAAVQQARTTATGAVDNAKQAVGSRIPPQLQTKLPAGLVPTGAQQPAGQSSAQLTAIGTTLGKIGTDVMRKLNEMSNQIKALNDAVLAMQQQLAALAQPAGEDAGSQGGYDDSEYSY